MQTTLIIWSSKGAELLFWDNSSLKRKKLKYKEHTNIPLYEVSINPSPAEPR